MKYFPVFCALVLAIPCLQGCSTPSTPEVRRITVIAHRGNSSRAPENTLAAFRSAVEAGADYVELDARPSADGTIWVLHDATLDRTTNAVQTMNRKKVAIASVRDAELRQLNAGLWFSAQFIDEKLPTLADSLDVIQSGSRTLLEHKDGSAPAYAELLRRKGYVDKLIVQSFNWDFLQDMHRILPEQTLAALGGKELTDEKIADLPRTGAKIVAWQYQHLTAEHIARLHGLGYRVWTWTVDEPAEWERLVTGGIDGIITNKPIELREWLVANQSLIPQNVQ